MSRFSDTVYTDLGNGLKGPPVPGASVYVYEWDVPSGNTGALAALTDDDLVTPLPNPLTTDEFGEFYFNAAVGYKLLEFHYAGRLLYREQILVGAVESAQSFSGLVDAALTTAGLVFNVYGLSDPNRVARLLVKPTVTPAHIGVQHSLFGIEGRVTGSGANGPTNADIGFTVSMVKAGWPNAGAAIGEIDGFNSVVRQGGTTSDAAAYLADVAGCNHTGFLCAFEGSTQRLHDTTHAVIQSVRVQAAALDNVTGEELALYGLAETGIIDFGLILKSVDGSNKFSNFITLMTGPTVLFNIDGAGGMTFSSFTANADAPVTGYVPIKTTDGTTRKLAVIA